MFFLSDFSKNLIQTRQRLQTEDSTANIVQGRVEAGKDSIAIYRKYTIRTSNKVDFESGYRLYRDWLDRK